MTIINNKVVSTTIIERFFEITQLFYRKLLKQDVVLL